MAVSHTGRLLRDKIMKEIQIHADDIAAGNAKDYSEYRWLVGFIAGMRQALAVLDEIERGY